MISWDDRFEALKKFKEQHGHCKIPRNHPDFGNWPVYQKSQYKLYRDGKKSKITKEKADKLLEIGFLEDEVAPAASGPPAGGQPTKLERQLAIQAAGRKVGYDSASYEWA